MAVQIIVGNCLTELKKLRDNSVHICVTSPPYWNLRDYGLPPTWWGGDLRCDHVEYGEEKVTREVRKGMGLSDLSKRYRGGGKKAGKVPKVEIVRGSCERCGAWHGVLGLEPTPDLFIEHLVEIFEEVRRVLRPDGTLWVNMGDSYAGSGRGSDTGLSSTLEGSKDTQEESKRVMKRCRSPDEIGGTSRDARIPTRGSWAGMGLKPKDLVGAPWMLAFALRKAGWWLRQDDIWQKPNPMPESTTDRCTKAHEYIFHLSKSEHYYFDQEAIKEEAIYNAASGRAEAQKGQFKDGKRGQEPDLPQPFRAIRETRNKRSVWTVATVPFAEAHFATFPPELIETPILAGTSERGCCVHCATGWERITAPTDRYLEYLGRSTHSHSDDSGKGMMQHRGQNTQNQMRDEGGIMSKETETLGWYPGCDCDQLGSLPELPPSPRLKRADSDKPMTAKEEAQLEEMRVVWRRRCRKVYQKWREIVSDPKVTAIKTKPAVVLDPFGGAGTTGVVADRYMRDGLLIEMNPDYAAMAGERVQKSVMPLFSVA